MTLPHVFRDPHRPVTERVTDLLNLLEPEEKRGLLHQHQAAVPRLGLGPFRTGTEALHGVAWLGPATVFPQAVGLAASWNAGLLRAVGSAVGDEVRAFHAKDPAAVGLNVWAPVVNPLRDPRWGRNEEGYSEDPWLTGVLATAYGHGLAGEGPPSLKTAPTLKHFLAYNNEADRCTTSSGLPARVLREYELLAFEAPLKAGAAVAVMPSYNLVNGRPAHLTPLINDVLREAAELFVVSDAGAPTNLFDLQRYYPDGASAYAAALRAGVDSFTQDDDDPRRTVQLFAEALERGLITQQDIDRAASRALTLRVRLGEFDPEPERPTPPDVVGCQAHRDLARDAAAQSFVLLKNADGLLPLAPDVRRIAVLGPLADVLQEDWYSGTLPYQVTAAKALTERLGCEAVEYCEGADRVRFAGQEGDLDVDADSMVGLTSDGEGFDLFDWGGGVCMLRSARTGRYLTAAEDGTLRADHPGPNSWVVNETFELVPGESGTRLRHHTSGRFVTVTPEGRAILDTGPSFAFDVVTIIDGAVRAALAAARADAAVVVVGNHPLVNGRETEDRVSLDLPAGQERLVRAVHAAGPSTVLVMASSYPFSVGWADRDLPAVLWSAHGGQEYGHALADVLFGTVDAAGRLPQTWYRSEADLPDLLDYDIITSDATYQYFRGDPLYPFGHGLSYTTFGYSDLEFAETSIEPDGDVRVRCTVTNTGSRAGHEVVQLYTHQQASRVKQPLRRLRAFQHLDLSPGESARIELTFPAADLAGWDVIHDRYWVERARHSILIGRSCADIRLSGSVEVLGEPIPPRELTVVPAVAFDEYCGITLTDAGLERGDAVRSEHAGAWLAFDDADLGTGPSQCTLTVASELSGSATLELRLDDPYHGPLLATVDVAPTGHRHTWTQLTTPIADGSGVHTLYAVFAGAGLLLRELSFS